MIFLTPDELERFCGTPQRKLQLQILDKRRVPYIVNRRGEVLVLCSSVEAAFKSPQGLSEVPDLSNV